MIDLVQFRVNTHDLWVKELGFHQFLFDKDAGVVVGGDENKHLKIVTYKQADILVGPELVKKPDGYHWRSSGLNQVLAKLAYEHDVAIGFPLHFLLQADHIRRSILLGRMMQNIRLCRKYHVQMVLCSFARDIWGLRSASDMQSFGRALGMTPAEARKALDFQRRAPGVRVR